MESIKQEQKTIQPIAKTINSSIFQKITWYPNETPTEKQHRLDKLEQLKQKDKEHEERQRIYREEKMILHSFIPKLYIKTNITDFIINENNNSASYALTNFHNSYYIFGECGTGKTFLASLIAKKLIHEQIQPYFFTTTNLIFLLNPYKTPEKAETSAPIIERHQIYNCHTLIIDDIGVEKPSPLNTSILFDLINHRYNEELQTIFTSNFNIKELQKRFGSYEGGRLGRRIVTMCKPIFLKFVS